MINSSSSGRSVLGVLRQLRGRTGARLAGLIAALLAIGPVPAWLEMGRALADEYEPVTNAATTRTDPNPFLIAAYGFIWAALLVYVIGVARGLGRARAEVAELRRRVDAATAGRP
jgi:hypothetical protein